MFQLQNISVKNAKGTPHPSLYKGWTQTVDDGRSGKGRYRFKQNGEPTYFGNLQTTQAPRAI